MTSYLLKNGCFDSWSWTMDDTAPHQNHFVYEINPRSGALETSTYNFHALRGTKVLNSDAHYCEVQVTGDTDRYKRITNFLSILHIGVVRGKPLKPDMKLEPLNKNDDRRWGRLLIDYKQVVIGVLLVRTLGTLSYYQDGMPLEMAITVPDHLDYELFPAVWTIFPGTDIMLVRRLRSFYNDNNLQDRCRATIMELISEKTDIDLLNLPTAMKDYLRDGYYEYCKVKTTTSTTKSVIDYITHRLCLYVSDMYVLFIVSFYLVSFSIAFKLS